MLPLLWLIPTFPIAGFAILILLGARLRRRTVSTIAVGSVAASALVAMLIGIQFLAFPPAGHRYSQALWTWFHVGHLASTVAFYLDALSLTMVLVVTFVSLLIHVYSTAFMADDRGYARFFAYMNLFVGAMLVLLLAEDLLVLYLGWEGVGLCSYLLIGFWYQDPANARAAMKAFLVTRVGDTALAVGLFVLVTHFGTLHIPTLAGAISRYPTSSALCTTIALLLLAGAVGKSAQLPLQTWLPDAMAGPTPVSALIHAATMVTAGVYLVARTHAIFVQAPAAMTVMALLGTATLLLAAFSACVQHDIKRILAYSTMSQVGYMFLALGVGAWYAAIYHFATHAFFKSTLFLGAGVLIQALNEEHSIFKMGGLRKSFPATYRAFLAGSLTLAAVPPLTATFNSKDVILNQAWLWPQAGPILWTLGLVGAFLTALYTFRLIFVVFWGPAAHPPQKQEQPTIVFPLSILALLAALSGLPELLKVTTGAGGFYDFLDTAAPQAGGDLGHATAWGFQAIYAATAGAAIVLAYAVYARGRTVLESVTRVPVVMALHGFLKEGWGFDWLYTAVLVRPYVWMARKNRNDFLDGLPSGVTRACQACHRVLSVSVTGNVRWYVGAIALGSILVLAFVILS